MKKLWVLTLAYGLVVISHSFLPALLTLTSLGMWAFTENDRNFLLPIFPLIPMLIGRYFLRKDAVLEMRLEFWTEWWKLTQKKTEYAYLKRYHISTICPYCRRKSFEKGEYREFKEDEWKEEINSGVMVKTCGCCGFESRWHMGAPVPILLDK